MRRLSLVGLLVLVAGTAYFRFTAIDWGAPFVYHPDEHFVVHPALDMVRTRTLNPHWFQYPSLLLYLEAALVAILRLFTGASLESNYLVNGIGPWDVLPEQWPFVLAGRLLVATAAIAGVVLLARTGERLYDTATGLVAGAFLMVAPLHNESSHYLTTDVPATTLVIACMAASAARSPNWLLAGILAGLAAGTKYTAGIALLVPALAALDLRAPSETVSRWVRVAAGFVAGFLVATPYALLESAAFWDGVLAQRSNYFAWKGQQGNLQWYLDYLYVHGLGKPLAALAGLGLLFGLVQALRTPRRAALHLAFVLPPLLYIPWIASYPSRAERNLIVVLPFLCLAAAALLGSAAALLRPRWLGSALLATATGAVLFTAMPSLSFRNQLLRVPDTRTLALEWIRANVPRGAKLVREEYTPQVQTGEYDVAYVFSLAQRPYFQYLGDKVDYLVASSNIYGRAINPPYITGESGRAFYEVLFGLPLAKEFPQVPFGNGPTVRIYRVPAAR